MKDLIKYFNFSIKISQGRLFLFIILSLFAAAFQTISASCILTAISYGSGLGDSNFLSKKIIDIIRPLLPQNSTNSLLAFLLGLTSISFFISGLTMLLNEWYKAEFLRKLYIIRQKEIMSDLFSTDFQIFLNYNIGELSNMSINQIKIVINSLKFFITVITSSIFTVSYLILPFFVNYQITITAIIIGTPVVFIIRFISGKIKKLSLETVSANSQINNVLLQMITYYKYLKATETYQNIYIILDKVAKLNAKLMIKLAVYSSILPNLLTPLAIVLICILTYWQVAVMNIPIIEACAALGLLYHAIQKGITIPTSYQKFLSSAGSIDAFLKFKNEITLHKEEFYKKNKLKKPDFSGSIRLDNISFKYYTANKDAVSNISLTIPPKSMVGFVGESGSGKSTLINIITALLKPSSGKIYLSETAYDELDIIELRKSIAYVTQDPVIFNDTIKNNITLWNAPCNYDKLSEAVTYSSANSFISQLDNSFETILGDSGANISGGQKQRIAIARELYRNTPILIMDEATSALDSQTEKTIQETLKKMHGNKTIIIIAHRLSTIKDCDKIFVLHKGQLIEEGSFQELYNKGGKFKEMVDKQAL